MGDPYAQVPDIGNFSLEELNAFLGYTEPEPEPEPEVTQTAPQVGMSPSPPRPAPTSDDTTTAPNQQSSTPSNAAPGVPIQQLTAPSNAMPAAPTQPSATGTSDTQNTLTQLQGLTKWKRGTRPAPSHTAPRPEMEPLTDDEEEESKEGAENVGVKRKRQDDEEDEGGAMENNVGRVETRLRVK